MECREGMTVRGGREGEWEGQRGRVGKRGGAARKLVLSLSLSGFYAQSASEAIFRARTYNRITYSVR